MLNKQEIIYISNIFNMIAYETEYDKIFNTRNELIKYQRLILTFYKEYQKKTKDIVNVFKIERTKIKIKYYNLYKTYHSNIYYHLLSYLY